MNRSEFRVRVAARSSLPRAYAASARTAVISTFTNGPQSTRRCWLSGLGRHRDARIPKHFTQGADVALQIWTMFAFVPQPALRPPGTRTFVTERDSTLKSTGLDYASMRSNRQKPHAAARQFPARSKSCDRATRRCAPVIADTLPPCLRPATAHGPTADETQPTHKQRTHDFTGLTATAPAQFTTFVAGRDFALLRTGLDGAYVRSGRRRSHAAARQFPVRTKSCDRTTRSCAPLVEETLPPCLRPAATHSPALGETQANRKHRTHESAVPTATAYPPFTTFRAERRCGDFFDPSNMRTHAQSRADIECLSRGHSLYRDVQIASYDRPAQACASVEADTLPRRLRPPSVKSRSSASVPSTTKSPVREVLLRLMPRQCLEQVLESTCLARTDCRHVVRHRGTPATVSAHNPSYPRWRSPMPAPESIIMPSWRLGSVALRSRTSLAARPTIHYHSTRTSHRGSRSTLHGTANNLGPG